MTTEVQQVGGTHYQAKYQHWDWAVDTRLGWLEGNASKYLARFRKKGVNAIRDVEKALSYIEKLRAMLGTVTPAGYRPHGDVELLERFLDAAELDDHPEAQIIRDIDGWVDDNDLLKIVRDIENLLEVLRREI